MTLINIKELEKTLRIEEGTLTKAIESEEETTVEIPDLHIITADEHRTRESNIAIREDELKKESKTAGVEMAVKEIRNELGYDFQGKTIPNLLKAHEEKILADNKLDVDPKIKTMQSDLDQMTSNYQNELVKVDGLNGQISEIKNNSIIDNSLGLGGIDPTKLTASIDDIQILYKHKHSIKVNDGVAVMLKPDGEVLKDTNTLTPITVEQHYKQFVTENYIGSAKGGAGGGDDTGAKGGSWESFITEMEAKGITQGSQEFNTEMSDRISNKTLNV